MKRAPRSSYGSTSKWRTLGPNKMLLIVGLTMFPGFGDASVGASINLPRVRVQGYDCRKPARVRSSAVPQHCLTWNKDSTTETTETSHTYELFQH